MTNPSEVAKDLGIDLTAIKNRQISVDANAFLKIKPDNWDHRNAYVDRRDLLKIVQYLANQSANDQPETLLEDTDPATVFTVTLSVEEAVNVIEDGLLNSQDDEPADLALNLFGLLIDASTQALGGDTA
jgi:hypothetical protein